jgi:putative site-specific DNA-methyltransferase (adenine-specific)|nr:MAG TPA: Helicase of the snf2 rad54 family [Bacteriophage sp.]
MNVLEQVIENKYAIYNGDSCEIVRAIPDNSIHYTIFSPPFASLYTYSNSDRDMGNSKGDDEFYNHFIFLAKELYRVTMPGRLLSFHCMDLPLMKERDGVIGLKDFPAIIRNIFEDCGFIYHSKVTIWKNPVTEMQRTKALGLLHKQIRKDSTMNRQGIPDYIITMRKPGENPERVAHTHETFPVDVWQNYASPVWMDIRQSDTLQKKSAREDKDERHICPLQLEVIQRCIELWTNPNDIVLDPFAGIGSVPYTAVKMGRRGIGVELKESYYKQAVNNLEIAVKGDVMECPVGQMSIEDFLTANPA